MDIFAPHYSRKGKVMNGDGTFIELEPLTKEECEFTSFFSSSSYFPCKDQLTEFLYILINNLFE